MNHEAFFSIVFVGQKKRKKKLKFKLEKLNRKKSYKKMFKIEFDPRSQMKY